MKLADKKIMILGGGQAQIDLIRKAKGMGITTIVVGIEGNYPGYRLADKVYHVDINDKQSVLNIAKQESIDGICMVCSDYGLQTLGYVCDNYNLIGISEEAAIKSSNKLMMKNKLHEFGVNTAKYLKLTKEDNIKELVSDLQFPLMVKAVDLQGSKGVFRCDSIDDINSTCSNAIELSRENYCIVEEYLEGEDFGAQAFVYNGKILFVQAHGDDVLKIDNSSIPIGHYMPYQNLIHSLDYEIHDVVSKSIKALGFDNCAVNVDLILKDNIPYVIELTGRAGANFLPEVTGCYLGLNYYEMVLLCSLGESPEKYYQHRVRNKNKFVMSRQLFSGKDGVIKSIYKRNNLDIKICSLFFKEGDCVHKIKNSSDCIGKILCVGNSKKECSKIIEEYLAKDLIINIQ